MSVYGVDLAEWYAAGRWMALLEYIDMLPPACRLNEAIVNDPEMADLLVREKKPEQAWAPRVSEFDLNAHLLREILHILKALRQTTLAVAGQRPPEEKPFPVPQTQLGRAQAEADQEWAVEFASQFGFSPADI